MSLCTSVLMCNYLRDGIIENIFTNNIFYVDDDGDWSCENRVTLT